MSTSPSVQFTSLRPDLAETLHQFDLEADQMGFVGLQIAPVIEVDVPVGQYGVIELKEMLKSRSTRRAEDGSYQRGGGRGTKDSYTTEEHGFEERVDEREAAMFAGWWDAEQLAAQRSRDAVIRNHNDRVIAIAEAVATTTAAGTAWTDTASATPIDNVRTAKLAIRDRTGLIPNALCLEWDRFQYLQSNAQILDRLFGTVNPSDARRVNREALARAFDLEEVIVAGSMKNTANENQAASLATQWTKTNALLFVKSTDRNMRRPRYMNTFHWGADGSLIGAVLESYEDPSRRGTIIRSRMDTDEKEVYAACAQRITGV